MHGSIVSIESHDTVVRIIAAMRDGDAGAMSRLHELVYDELRRLARTVRRGRAGMTLNTTALVHEAYIKLAPSDSLDLTDKMHFMRVAARAMRQVLANSARARMAEKRGGGWSDVTLSTAVDRPVVRPEELVAMDEALERLAALDPRQAEIVDCRFFAGLTIEETAEAVGVGSATVKREWRTARAWLAREITR